MIYKLRVKNPSSLRNNRGNTTPTFYIQTLWLPLCKLFKPTCPCPCLRRYPRQSSEKAKEKLVYKLT